MSNSFYVLIITGPTASGKTSLSLKISEFFNTEIINIDVGQFYTKLSVGTAKPNWKNQKIPHHCFDLIDDPKDLSVFEFNKIILDKIKEICRKNKIPVLVGGSLFYIKSLFFPPKNLPIRTIEHSLCKIENESLWEKLNKIDPKRARVLHKNDLYRIQRALEIWEKTGVKPSEYKPEFNPKINARILFIDRKKEVLEKRINKRTIDMIKNGWINETENFAGSEWENFLKNKKLIGYPEIFKWIETGKDRTKINELIERIQIKTRQYAKRQQTFFNGFKKCLEREQKNKGSQELFVKVSFLEEMNRETILLIIQQIQNDLKDQS